MTPIIGSGSPPTNPSDPPSEQKSKWKRASRKGAPRKFHCKWPQCVKSYSRAEHLQRHQLNHAPKVIYSCETPGCDQRFVRADLLARHRKRHGSSYIPRNREPNFTRSPDDDMEDNGEGDDAPVSFEPEDDVPEESEPDVTFTPVHHVDQRRDSLRIAPATQPWSTPSTHRDPLSFGLRQPAIPPKPVTLPSPAAPNRTPLPRLTPAYTTPPIRPHPLEAPHSRMTTLDIQPSLMSPPDSILSMSQHPALPPITAPHSGKATGHSLSWPQVRHQPDLFLHPKANKTAAELSVELEQLAADLDANKDSFSLWLFDPTMADTMNLVDASFLGGGLEPVFGGGEDRSVYERTGLEGTVDADTVGLVGPEVAVKEQFTDAGYASIIHCLEQAYLMADETFTEKLPHMFTRDPATNHVPSLPPVVLNDFIDSFWCWIEPRMPIIHKPTFSINTAPPMLLATMLALGATSLATRQGGPPEYSDIADVIISGVRWNIMRSKAAKPPIELWVAQALLLVEMYEKLYSVRELHERAHVHHNTTFNLLRRGSPLIGRAGNETPVETVNDSSHTSWVRWAETEAMHRVVYAAFMIDVLHAAMFGHTSNMAAHEIRLPLPCIDLLWNAPSAGRYTTIESQQGSSARRMKFLDALRKTIHGQPLGPLPSFSKMIIMCGLFSVAWHIRRNSQQLRWLDPRITCGSHQGALAAALPEMRNFKMVLRALETWRGGGDGDMTGFSGAVGPISNAGVLYHMTHFSLFVDIVDCFVYAGVRRLIGRQVSSLDYINSVTRMKLWSREQSTRHAIHHAFKLLHSILTPHLYQVPVDPDPHRPWILYITTLAIWSFIRIYPIRHDSTQQPRPPASSPEGGDPKRPVDEQTYREAVRWVGEVAGAEELTGEGAEGLGRGVVLLLEVVERVLGGGRSELLAEARGRMRICREVLFSGTG